MPRSIGYVDPDYLRKVAEIAKSFKERTYKLLCLQEQSIVLDVGCGPGIDTIPLAKLVGAKGKVCGVDIDEEMLAEAMEYAERENIKSGIEHTHADVKNLPYDAACFDAVRAERLFQVLPITYSPSEIFSEILRVLKPGGRLVVADTDWGSASVDIGNPDLERRMMSFFAQRLRPNGFAGRQLYAQFADVGLTDIKIEVHPMLQFDFDQTPFGHWLQTEALNSDAASADEIVYWQKELSTRNEKGRFFACVNMLIASGTRRA